MKKLQSFLQCAYTGFIVGMFIAVILNRWIWLEMRANIALIIPFGLVFGGAAGLLVGVRTALDEQWRE